MRMSRLFSQTLRDTPANTDTISHQLLLRAGFIRQLGSGIYSYLPLAKRSLNKIEHIMHQEMTGIGGQEVQMPVVQPADIWKETGRWYQIGTEMGRFTDKSGHDMVLAMTHEEAVADIVRREVRSYRQLPALIYHIQTKWRDDPRPRAGLIRVREFTMLDSYSLDADWAGLDTQYNAHSEAYNRIFRRCGLPTVSVKADTGMMGGRLSHEFMYLSLIGEDTIMLCRQCGYTANRQVATLRKPTADPVAALPLTKVATPGITTITDLCRFLNIQAAATAKAVFMMASCIENDAQVNKFIFAVVRGDMEVNETKLANAVKARDLRPATDSEIRSIGAVPGYGSPIGVHDAIVVVDEAITVSPNLVAGANAEGFHVLNVNYGRDFKANIIADIAMARDGDLCPECGASLESSRGVEVGNIFQLGTRYSEAMHCLYQDADGDDKPVIMGSYGIGLGRLLACIAEEHHDDMGLCMPLSVAPYHVHLIALKGDAKTEQLADQIYMKLQAGGIEVLYDDRGERPGVKFMDADLIGLPLRITVGERALARGGVELKHRRNKASEIVPIESIDDCVNAELGMLWKNLTSVEMRNL